MELFIVVFKIMLNVTYLFNHLHFLIFVANSFLIFYPHITHFHMQNVFSLTLLQEW